MRRSIFKAGVWTALGLAIAFAIVSANSNTRRAVTTTTAPVATATVASHDDCASSDVCCARDSKVAKAVVAAAPRKTAAAKKADRPSCPALPAWSSRSTRSPASSAMPSAAQMHSELQIAGPSRDRTSRGPTETMHFPNGAIGSPSGWFAGLTPPSTSTPTGKRVFGHSEATRPRPARDARARGEVTCALRTVWQLPLSRLAARASSPLAHAATIVIINNDGAAKASTIRPRSLRSAATRASTLGAQRLFVFQYAANIWGNILPSTVTIHVVAAVQPADLQRDQRRAGQRRTRSRFRDFPDAPFRATWYPGAAGEPAGRLDLVPSGAGHQRPVQLGAGRRHLPGRPGWYYGVDGNEGAQGRAAAGRAARDRPRPRVRTFDERHDRRLLNGGAFPTMYDQFLFDTHRPALGQDDHGAARRVGDQLRPPAPGTARASTSARRPPRAAAEVHVTLRSIAGLQGRHASFGAGAVRAACHGPVTLVERRRRAEQRRLRAAHAGAASTARSRSSTAAPARSS